MRDCRYLSLIWEGGKSKRMKSQFVWTLVFTILEQVVDLVL